MMEFLDINSTKGSSPLLHVIHSPFHWRILTKTIFFSGFKNPFKKIPETRKLKSIHVQHFVEQKNEGRKLESEKTRVYAQKTQLKMPFKNSISGSTSSIIAQIIFTPSFKHSHTKNQIFPVYNKHLTPFQ